MNADQFFEEAYGGRTDGEAGSATRKLRESYHERMVDGVPKRVSDAIWESACNKSRDYRGRVDKAVATRKYKEEIARTIAKTDANRKKRAAASLRKAEAKARMAALARRSLTKDEIDDAISLSQEDGPIVDPVDDWEQLATDTINGPAAQTSSCLKGIIMERDGDITFSTPPGHAVLAASRSVMALEIRKDGLAKMHQQARPNNKPVLFEVGAGANGVKAAVNMKQKYVEAADVYFHCTFPVAGADDLARDVLLLGRTKFAHDLTDCINWVDRTGAVMLNKVNVCSHLARDCNCLSLYGPSYVYAMHSSYYFEDSDWDQLFRYTDDVRIGVHLPERNNQVVPSDVPEFRWQYLETTQSIVQHFGMVAAASKIAERLFLGVKHVAFHPLAGHGTTYQHRNIAEDIRRGGFHIVKYTREVDGVLRNPIAAAATLTGVAVAAVQLPAAVRKICRGQVPWGEMAMAALCAAPAWIASAVGTARASVDPPPLARYTVKVIPGWDYVRQGETICQVYQARRAPLSRLEQRIIETRRPNVAKAREMAASLALSNNPEKAGKAVAAMGFRAGLNPVELRDTIDAAKDYCSLVIAPKNGPPTAANSWMLGSGPVWSVLGLTPSESAVRLGVIAVAGGCTKELLSTLHSQLGVLSMWRGMSLQNISYMIAQQTKSSADQIVKVSYLFQAAVPRPVGSAWEQLCAAWSSPEPRLSPTVRSWLSTHLRLGTSAPRPTLLGPVGSQ